MKRVLKCILIGFLTIIFVPLTASCTRAKTFKGKVIDADTKEPIEGAVVVVVWETERDTPTATHADLKDVKECLTNKNGEWSISGPQGRANELIPGLSLFIPYTKEPQFIIFKSGYCSWPNGFSIDACRGKINPGGNGKIREGETVELSKLTKREDRLKALPGPVSGEGALEKQKEFIREINEERKNLGLKKAYY